MLEFCDVFVPFCQYGLKLPVHKIYLKHHRLLFFLIVVRVWLWLLINVHSLKDWYQIWSCIVKISYVCRIHEKVVKINHGLLGRDNIGEFLEVGSIVIWGISICLEKFLQKLKSLGEILLMNAALDNLQSLSHDFFLQRIDIFTFDLIVGYYFDQ